MNDFTAMATVAFFFAAYFFPTIIASNRKHRNKSPICLVNLIFGWTFIGWVFALIWAMTDNVNSKS